MDISGFRPGPFAGPILIAAAIMMAGAGAAQAACPDLIKAFDNAVAERQVDAAISGLNDISDSPSQMCLGRFAEFRAKLVDFLLDYAGTPGLPKQAHDNAIAKAEKTVAVSGYWQGKAKLADYYFAHGDKPMAHHWYVESVAALATPGAAATDDERRKLAGKLAAAQSLANDDKGGQRRILNPVHNRDASGRVAGVLSPALVHVRTAEVVAVPMPINFVYNQATFTPAGEDAVKELIEAAQQQQITTMKLVGHTDPRGAPEYNMKLSRERVLAVRDRLVQAGVKAQITVKGVGADEPFDVSVLPDGDKLSQEEIWQLDRRVVWLRDAERD
jgi:outer membrane protein OmpA-like peptidoglycan-associated protein